MTYSLLQFSCITCSASHYLEMLRHLDLYGEVSHMTFACFRLDEIRNLQYGETAKKCLIWYYYLLAREQAHGFFSWRAPQRSHIISLGVRNALKFMHSKTIAWQLVYRVKTAPKTKPTNGKQWLIKSLQLSLLHSRTNTIQNVCLKLLTCIAIIQYLWNRVNSNCIVIYKKQWLIYIKLN